MGDPCVVGLDVGGTHSRAVLATVGGRVLGTGRAGGGNPTVLGAGAAIANIVAALRSALGDVPGERVGACVVGLAGVSTLMADPKAPAVLEQAWADAGLTCTVRIVSDVTVSFAAGTPRADGTLLVSGTGAVAARMRDRLPAQFRDGYGWLLGDDGSGYWIGRQAARATIAAVDGRAPMAELAKAVLEALLEPGSERGSSRASGLAGTGTGGHPWPEGVLLGLGDGSGSAAVSSSGATTSSGATSSDTATSSTPVSSSGATTSSGATSSGAATNSATTTSSDTATSSTPVSNSAPLLPDTDPAPAPGENPKALWRQNPDSATPIHPTSGKDSNPTDKQSLTSLATAIGEGFASRSRRRAAELVRAVTAQPTVALGSLAPLVMTAYELGDPAARRIVEEAALVLVESLAAVGPAAGEPVVLGGSVLVSRSPVFEAVAAAVGRRWPDSPLGLAHDGAAGATWLAARELLGEQEAARVHRVFTGDGRDPKPSAKFS